MNNIFKNCLSAGFLGVFALIGFTACTDDHFDIFSGDGSSNQTIWQNIQQNDHLDSLEMILSRAYMMRSETDKIDPTSAKTLGELLDQPQSFTAWMPIDGTYNAKQYLDILDEADTEYEVNGVSTAYLKLMYKVSNQFGYNHIARFNYESTPSTQEVILLNAKKVDYTSGTGVFNGVKISGAPIVSSNGTMHLLSSISPFAYNIYDFINANENFTTLSAYLLDPTIDTYTFSENASVSGALNENGDMVYVDSVYSHQNEIINSCGARLQDEDSLYVAILPSNTAWDAAVEKLSKYFNYNTTYNYSWSTSNNSFTYTGSNAYKLDADSLKDYNVKKAMIQSSFFSPSTWHGISEAKDSAEVINYTLHADSLISTNYTCFYNSNKGGENPMFNAQAPLKASNGYIFAVDDYKVAPEYVWMTRNEIDATSTWAMAQPSTEKSNCTSTNGSTINLSSDNRNDTIIDPYEITRYQRFERSNSRAAMTIEYRWTGVLSGAYRVKAIMLPSRMCFDVVPDTAETETATFYVQVLDDKGNAMTIAEGNNGTSKTNQARSKDITISQDEVKEYTLIEKINIPYCYYNLPNGVESFCRLKFTCEYNRKIDDICKGLNIYKIIFEPYRDDVSSEE